MVGSQNNLLLKYLSALSAKIATTLLPGILFAIFTEASMVARALVAIISVLSKSTIFGMKPDPRPCILCGPALPPDSTGDSAGSTATISMRALNSLPQVSAVFLD
jgi:hypothetical protein